MHWIRRLFVIEPVNTPGASATAYVPLVMASRALAFLRTLLVARILGDAGRLTFGEYQPALEWINVLVVLVMFGAADVAERYVSHMQRGGGGVLKRWLDRHSCWVIARGLAVGVLLIALWPWISQAIWGRPELYLVIMCALVVLLLAGYQHIAAMLRGLRAYAAAAGMELMGAILLLVFSAIAACTRDAALLVAAYGLSVAVPAFTYAVLIVLHLRRADLPPAVSVQAWESGEGVGTLAYAPRVEPPNKTSFAAWAMVRLLLMMLFGFLSLWGVRVLAGPRVVATGDLDMTAQFAMPFRIAQLLAFLAVTLWASTYGIAAKAWSHGQVRRAKVQLFRVGRFGAAALALTAVALLLIRGLFAWLLPTYSAAIVNLLPGLLAVFFWYALVAFFSTFSDLREQPQRGAALWGLAVLVQVGGIAIYRLRGHAADPKELMLTLSAAGLLAALLLAAPCLLCRPIRFAPTGVPLAVLGLAATTLFCPEWVVDWIAAPVMLGAVLFLYGAGLLVRPMDRRAFRRWQARRTGQSAPAESRVGG